MPKISGVNLADHRQKTWDALLDAVDDVVAEQAFDATSLRDIGARAGIARTAVYNYAPDKTALLVAAIERAVTPTRLAVEAVMEDRASPAAERLGAVVDILLNLSDRSARLLHLARTIGDSNVVAAHTSAKDHAHSVIQRHLERLLRDGITDGSVPATIDIGLLVALVGATLDAAMMRASSFPDDASEIRVQTVAFLRAALAHGAART